MTDAELYALAAIGYTPVAHGYYPGRETMITMKRGDQFKTLPVSDWQRTAALVTPAALLAALVGTVHSLETRIAALEEELDAMHRTHRVG